MSVVDLEISEFVRNPIRTGIQRVVREVIRHWPRDAKVRFTAFDPTLDQLYEVPDRAVHLAVDGPDLVGVAEDELKSWIAAADAPARRRALASADMARTLVPEVFYDRSRMGFYRSLRRRGGGAPAIVVHDFSVYFDPNAFGITQGGSNFFLPYLYFVRDAGRRVFTNDVMRDQFRRRIERCDEIRDGDLVARLGCDGPKIPRQSWSAERTTILCLGSFDGKKNQEVLFEAYAGSPRLQAAFHLQFIGRRPETWQGANSAIFESRLPKLSILNDASDPDVVEAFAHARATVFIGTAEGFGLPAVESLAAGVPVVAWQGLPALSGLPDLGQVRLPHIDAASVATALETLIDDEVAAAKFAETAHLRLESWGDFSRRLADWMTLKSERTR